MSEPRAEPFAGVRPLVTYALQDGVATTGLNQPAKRNAIHGGMLGALQAAAAERAGASC